MSPSTTQLIEAYCLEYTVYVLNKYLSPSMFIIQLKFIFLNELLATMES